MKTTVTLLFLLTSLNISGLSLTPVNQSEVQVDGGKEFENTTYISQPVLSSNESSYIIDYHYNCTLLSNLSKDIEWDSKKHEPMMEYIISKLISVNEINESILLDLKSELTVQQVLLPFKITDILCKVFTSSKEDWPNLNTTTIQLLKIAEEYMQRMNYTEFRWRLSDEQRLLQSLMTNYNPAVRPVLNASYPVQLGIGLTLNQIDIDEKNQVLTTLVWLDQEWTDEKLIWNPKDYNGLETLRVPCRLLWLPDIVLYNSVEDMRDGYMQALAMVNYKGVVFWPPIVKYRGNCDIAIKYFPFDAQKCKLKLGSWSYDGGQVNLTKRRGGIDLALYQSNGEWELVRTLSQRNALYYPCCTDPYLDVTFTIWLERRTLYYVYNIIIPCIMLSILTLLSFWMKPDSGEKINLGLTILLAFSVFMLLIAESMPSTSINVPIIGIYITSSMCLTSFSVVSAVVVANINHQAEGDNVVPYWIHKFTHSLGRLVCVKMVSWEERHCNIRQLAKPTLQWVVPSHQKKASVIITGMGNTDKNENHKEHNGKVGTSPMLPRGRKKEDKIDDGEDDPLLKRLHTIVEHQEQMLHKQNTSDDWHSVATVIDRCLFWIYSIMMVSTTVGCLVIFPLTKTSIKGEGQLDPPL